MIARGTLLIVVLVLAALAVGPGESLSAPLPAAAAAPDGQMTWAVHISLAPTWFDPAEQSGLGLIAGHAYSAPYEDLKIKR